MDLWQYLLKRFDRDYLALRTSRQMHHASLTFTKSGTATHFHPEEMQILHLLLNQILNLWDLRARGTQNALNFTINKNIVYLSRLPDRFDGLKILHLSDLHFGAYKDLGAYIASSVREMSFDLVLITGDYRFRTTGPYEHVIAEFKDLMPFLSCTYGVYGILGNHDFIEMVPALEKAGMHLLVNESVNLGSGDDSFWIAGTDDPLFYGTHDLKKTMKDISPDLFVLFMAHSPELIYAAQKIGCDFYLCGHTHGGQVCLPGGYAVLTNSKCKRRYIFGPWQYENMQGYTSKGTGSSGVFARFFCQPEIVIHVLKKRS